MGMPGQENSRTGGEAPDAPRAGAAGCAAEQSRSAALSRGLSRAFIIAGVLLVAVGMAFLLRNVWVDQRAGDYTTEVMQQLAEIEQPLHLADPELPNLQGGMSGSAAASGALSDQGDAPSEPSFATGGKDMPVVAIEGNDWLGSVHIPSLELELPVMADCDDARLDVAPCRYSGSYKGDDMIVCGRGFDTQFGRLTEVGIGDEVAFVAVDGAVYRYQVSNIESVPLGNVSYMVGKGDWQLTLFTYNIAGDACYTLRCIRL